MEQIKRKYKNSLIFYALILVFYLVGLTFVIAYRFVPNEIILSVMYWSSFPILILSSIVLALVANKYQRVTGLYKIYILKSKKFYDRAKVNPRWRYLINDWEKELETFGFDVDLWLNHLVENKLL